MDFDFRCHFKARRSLSQRPTYLDEITRQFLIIDGLWTTLMDYIKHLCSRNLRRVSLSILHVSSYIVRLRIGHSLIQKRSRGNSKSFMDFEHLCSGNLRCTKALFGALQRRNKALWNPSTPQSRPWPSVYHYNYFILLSM